MLHDFLTTNRESLIERCRVRVAQRQAPQVSQAELPCGIPLFLDQLITILKFEQEGAPPPTSDLGKSAHRHGLELLRHGFTVEQVVRDYGDLCQAITGLAIEVDAPIQVDEFRTLNRCLDDGIAEAVTEFTHRREAVIVDHGVQALNERLGMLAHELRNHLTSAMLAVSAIKTGNVGLTGATAAVLDRSLLALRDLIDRSLADVRAGAGMPPRQQVVLVTVLIADLRVSAALEAKARGCDFSIVVDDDNLAISVDRDMLLSAAGNLLQNAFKFTQPHSTVMLRIYARGSRIIIDVQDQCGGLAPGTMEQMFLPFRQAGTDRSGMGLGLSICKRSVEANGGVLSVRNLVGSGCVFTIDLPRP